MYVATILKEKGSHVVTSGVNDSVRHVVRLLTEYRIGAAVVLD